MDKIRGVGRYYRYGALIRDCTVDIQIIRVLENAIIGRIICVFLARLMLVIFICACFI